MYILMILLKHPWIAFLKTYLAEQVSFYIYLKGLQENDQRKTYWKFGWKYFINVEVGHQYSWSEYISSVNDVARAAGCLTVSPDYVTYAFQSESTFYSCLNIKEPFSRNWGDIWSLCGWNGTRSHNYLICKRTPNHLAKRAK